jgi:putative SOS response-associated peptidase YedK
VRFGGFDWRHFVGRRIGRSANATVAETKFERSTDPTALMNLFLRFQTANGPRTVIAPAVPLKLASEIAETVISVGQYAEYIDRYVTLPIADRLTRLKTTVALADVDAQPLSMNQHNPSLCSNSKIARDAANLTPMQFASVLVFEGGQKTMRRMRWGFASASAAFGNRGAHIHVKAETIDTLPISAENFYWRRGLILARAKVPGAELNLREIQQHRLTPADGKPAAIAVVWERSAHEGRDDLLSFVVVTSPSIESVSNENRRPSLIQPKDWGVWLGEIPATPEELKSLLLSTKETNFPAHRDASTSPGKA